MNGGTGLSGRQIAKALAEAQAGATTWMASRDTTMLRTQAETFAQADLEGQRCGISVAELDHSVLTLRDRLVAEAGGVNILVNNDVPRPVANWSDSAEAFAQSMAANAAGLLLMTRAFGDHMHV